MILIIDCGSVKTPSIAHCIHEFMDVKTVKINDFREEMLSDYCGVVISGAPLLLTEIDPEHYLEKFRWLQIAELPVLGICFGHQILGLTFGASVYKQKEDRDWNTIEILEDDSLFDKIPDEFEMMEDHCETISIPPNFVHLCVSDSCINEAMRHIDKNLYGVQFHPEVSGTMGSLLFENFVKLCEQIQIENHS